MRGWVIVYKCVSVCVVFCLMLLSKSTCSSSSFHLISSHGLLRPVPLFIGFINCIFISPFSTSATIFPSFPGLFLLVVLVIISHHLNIRITIINIIHDLPLFFIRSSYPVTLLLLLCTQHYYSGSEPLNSFLSPPPPYHPPPLHK